MRLHADVRVIRSGQGRGQEDQNGVETRGLVGQADQLLADSSALVLLIDGQVGQIGAKAVIGDRARCPPTVLRFGR